MTLLLMFAGAAPEATDASLNVISASEVSIEAERPPREVSFDAVSESQVTVAAQPFVTRRPEPRYRAGPLPWLVFGGVELGNEARTLAYLQNRYDPHSNTEGILGISEQWQVRNADRLCPVLATDELGNRIGFLRPDASPLESSGDPAPWYEPAIPESAGFLGVIITRIDGLDSPVTRAVTERASGGSALGPQRLGQREVRVEGTLIATSCASLDYGKRWLSHVLSNDLCDVCEAYQLEVRTTCPPVERPEAGMLNLYDVALVEGPRRRDQQTGPGECCDYLDVEWRMAAADPWLYTCPVEQLPPTRGEDLRALIGGLTGEAAIRLDPPEPFGEVGAIITVTVGGPAVGDFEILARDLSGGGECPSIPNERPCLVIRFANVPAGSVVTIDGLRRRVRIKDALGGESDGLPYVILGDNEAFDWPAFSGCGETCVSVELGLIFDPNGVNPPTLPPGYVVSMSSQSRLLA